jgi:Protein of unknown function DUF262
MNNPQLFPGEDLHGNQEVDELTSLLSNEAINDKYIKGEVRIVTEQARYPLSAVPGMVASDDYQLNPEFQRRHRWDDAKKSRLIESFIMNVPIPPIFLYEDTFSHYEVMDGLQRLSAINDFYRDKFPLTDLEEWRELNGRRYSELPEQIKRGIDRRYLSSTILLQETAKTPEEALRLKQLVFERLNSGGIRLEPQEARNAIYNGPLNKLCIRLARNKYLCRLWGIPEPSEEELTSDAISTELLENDSFRKMEDVELVLRFFAYRQRPTFHRGAFRDYLDHFLKEGNLFPASVLLAYENLFDNTIELVYNTLGETAFHLYRSRKTGWAWFERPTTVLYDPIMFVFSQNLSRSAELIGQKDAIRQKLPDFYREHYGDFEGRYTNLSNLAERNRLFSSFVTETLNVTQ